ncbi:hypothetical protein [Nocardioides sp. SYSU D00038]|uniref:hypothetical protein n=1 Tax=Nocardioides sp. SYSU D00038 TaxID=2812554 RepID=UPI0019687EB6|nr:hypothetical protein [Nocardioides sp. SYSU D00038]
MTTSPVFCTILARNYLPKALTLADSLQRHDGQTLRVLLIDVARDEDLPSHPGVELLSTEALGLPEREVLHYATIYDLVELATAVKPVLLKQLLRDHEQAFYLDPDTYLAAPMVDLPDLLSGTEGGILLTPHFLYPPRPGDPMSEGHLLTVGFYNLGFCGVDRRALDFLDWWWGHLQTECLFDPMSGLFVDQKWMDVGAPLWRAGGMRHHGYNVGVGNLHERPLTEVDGVLRAGPDPLRLFHFHSFDTSQPQELSVRFKHSTADLRASGAVDKLCLEYAAILRRFEEELGDPPAYPYWTDTRGRRLGRQLRRSYRQAHLAGASLPLPFVAAEADAWEEWRRGAWKSSARWLVGDAAKSVRSVLPEQVAAAQKRFPRLTGKLRSDYVSDSGMWG